MDDQPGSPTDLWGLARSLGALRWLERSMFELAGQWGTSTDDPSARVLFASHSLHHGWHAEVLADRLPELRDLDVDTLTVPPSPEWSAAFEHLASLGPAAAPRLSAWFGGVVPAVVAAYEDLLEGTGPVAAPSVRRWVRHLLLDEREDLADGLRRCTELGVEVARPATVPAAVLAH